MRIAPRQPKQFLAQPHFSWRQLMAFVGIFATGGLSLVALILAAGVYATYEPENGTLASGAKQVTVAGASGGKAVQLSAPAVASTPTPSATPTPAPTPTPTPPAGWPNASSTGYQNAPGYPGSLANCSTSIQSNTTYSFCRFAPGFTVSGVTNVTFFGCRFDGLDASGFTNVQIVGGNNITFDYSSFIPQNLTAPPVAYNQSSQFGLWVHPTNPAKITIDHSNFWGFGNGIQFHSSQDPARPFTVRNSYFHDARDDGGQDHTDAILHGGTNSRYVVIDHNTIVSVGNTNGLALQDQTVRDSSITGNYFSGFGYTVAVGTGNNNTNVTFTDNTFGTDIQPTWGPLYGWPSGSGNLWRRNKWKIAAGTSWSPASNDGKYWWPNGTLSATDYAGQ